MPYPDSMPAPRKCEIEFYCRDCGCFFEVEGRYDCGEYFPYNGEPDCPRCGSENVE